MNTPGYYENPQTGEEIPILELVRLPESDQLLVMKAWFYRNYENPIESLPYDGREGGFQYIFGGPFDAEEELSNEFGSDIDSDIITNLAYELEKECTDWSGKDQSQDVDDYFYDDIAYSENPFDQFSSTISKIRVLADSAQHISVQQALYRMCFVSSVTALEAFLSEFFINKINEGDLYLFRFIENYSPFKEKKVSFSNVPAEFRKIRKTAIVELTDMIWHNLPKVSALYSSVLEINLPLEINNLIEQTHIRHDIVHRGGKNKKGVEHVITRSQVRRLTDDCEILASYIYFYNSEY